MEQMRCTESRTKLSVFDTKIADACGNHYVVVPGYEMSGKFGYFVCVESVIKNEFSYDQIYMYSNVQAFYPKTDEYTFQQVLLDLKQRTFDFQKQVFKNKHHKYRVQ